MALIESLIHPKATKKPTRTIHVFGQAIEFAAIKPGRFIAEVVDEAAVAALVKLKHLYRDVSDEFAELAGKVAAPSLAKAPAPTAPAPNRAAMQKSAAQAEAEEAARKEAEKAAAKGNVDDPTVNDLDAAARALLGSTPVAIKRQLDKKTPPRDVLARAVELESGADKPREMVLAHLRTLLKNAEQE